MLAGRIALSRTPCSTGSVTVPSACSPTASRTPLDRTPTGRSLARALRLLHPDGPRDDCADELVAHGTWTLDADGWRVEWSEIPRCEVCGGPMHARLAAAEGWRTHPACDLGAVAPGRSSSGSRAGSTPTTAAGSVTRTGPASPRGFGPARHGIAARRVVSSSTHRKPWGIGPSPSTARSPTSARRKAPARTTWGTWESRSP